MKVAVLVPSHINYDDQLLRLDKCLESLCSQTVVPDIFVSISFDNNAYKIQFTNLLRKYKTVKFRLSEQRKFQMEHLSILVPFTSTYDMVMFCDDDDSYLPKRVMYFIEAFEKTKELCINTGNQFGGVRELKASADDSDSPEYWSYGIIPEVLSMFFNRIKGYEHLMRHKFADMYLRTYLSNLAALICVLEPDSSGLSLYRYTLNNPNSICMRQKLETNHTIIRDNVILSLICNRADLLMEQLNAASVPLRKLYDVVPDTDKIVRLTEMLYAC